MTTSTRGRCSGSEPRPARRVSARARLQRRIGLLLLGLGFGDRLFEILQREIELVGIELFRAPAELQPLQLADQVAQPVILAGSWSHSAASCAFSARSASRSAQAVTSIARSAATSFGRGSEAEFMARLDHAISGL